VQMKASTKTKFQKQPVNVNNAGQKLVGMGVGKVNSVHVLYRKGSLRVLILS